MNNATIDFISPAWAKVFRIQNHFDFERIWKWRGVLVDDVNWRKGGWSGVIRISMRGEKGKEKTLYIKRQFNHVFRSPAHLFYGAPTFVREMKGIQVCKKIGVSVANPVYFAVRGTKKNVRSILITEEVEHSESLDHLFEKWNDRSKISIGGRRRIMVEVARSVACCHNHRFQHRALYPKHIMIRASDASQSYGCPLTISLIDLEKSRFKAFGYRFVLDDLDRFHRHSEVLSTSDRMCFLNAYLESSSLAFEKRWLWNQLASRLSKRKRPITVGPLSDLFRRIQTKKVESSTLP